VLLVQRDLNVKLLAELKALGMIVNEVPAAGVERMKVQLQPVVSKFTAEIGPELIGQVQGDLAKVPPVQP